MAFSSNLFEHGTSDSDMPLYPVATCSSGKPGFYYITLKKAKEDRREKGGFKGKGARVGGGKGEGLLGLSKRLLFNGVPYWSGHRLLGLVKRMLLFDGVPYWSGHGLLGLAKQWGYINS